MAQNYARARAHREARPSALRVDLPSRVRGSTGVDKRQQVVTRDHPRVRGERKKAQWSRADLGQFGHP